MLAAILKDFNRLELEDIPIPEPGAGEVTVKVKSCGFCATDYKAIKGIRRNVTFPLIPGHEPAGIVYSVGPLVDHFKEGDEVAIQPSGSCGLCSSCRTGNHHYCKKAFVIGGDGPDDVWPGAFAQYTKTRQTCLFHKPSGISFDAAALTEPLSGAWKGLIQNSEMKIGDDVVIIGVGGIGLLCMMVAHAAGASRLIAIDTSEYALQQASGLGATHCINPNTIDAVKEVYRILPDGPDLILEAAGQIEAVKLMVELRRRGTKWNIFGITTHEMFELDGGKTHFLEGRMDASFGTTPMAMHKALKLIQCGLVDPEKTITHRFPLTEIADAVNCMDSGERNKVMINP